MAGLPGEKGPTGKKAPWGLLRVGGHCLWPSPLWPSPNRRMSGLTLPLVQLPRLPPLPLSPTARWAASVSKQDCGMSCLDRGSWCGGVVTVRDCGFGARGLGVVATSWTLPSCSDVDMRGCGANAGGRDSMPCSCSQGPSCCPCGDPSSTLTLWRHFLTPPAPLWVSNAGRLISAAERPEFVGSRPVQCAQWQLTCRVTDQWNRNVRARFYVEAGPPRSLYFKQPGRSVRRSDSWGQASTQNLDLI